MEQNMRSLLILSTITAEIAGSIPVQTAKSFDKLKVLSKNLYYMSVWCSGNISAFQADVEGSIPFTDSIGPIQQTLL